MHGDRGESQRLPLRPGLARPNGVAYYPIALPITGVYNRLGSIDGIAEDENTRLIHDYFRARLDSGDLVLEECYAREGTGDLETLLGVLERNVTQGEDAALLSGRPVLFALIDKAVWDASADAGTAGEGPNGARFRRVFQDVPAAEGIYHGSVGKVAKHLEKLARVCDFLEGRGLAWRCRTEGGAQHYGEEMRDYLVQARRAFEDCPPMLEGLDAYEKSVRELLEDG